MINIIQDNIVKHISALVKFKTVSSIKDEFHQNEINNALLYIKTEILKNKNKFFYKEIKHNGSPTLIIGTENTLTPDIGLSAHIDVVSAPDEMFNIKIKDNKIYGRGVADMKFALGIFLEIFKMMKLTKESPSVSIIITSDEEIGSPNGAKYIAEELGYHPKLMFVPDGGEDWRLIQKAKGALQVKIVATGRSAHASRPWEGVSANDKLINFLLAVRNIYPEIINKNWDSITANIGVIKGGQSANQISDRSEAIIDFRFPKKENKKQIIKNLSAKIVEGINITYPAEAYCFDVDLKNKEIQRFIKIIENETKKKIQITNEFSATDARFFSQFNTRSIVLMPPIKGIHSNEEWISLQGIIDYYNSLLQFINLAKKENYK